jgi:hypothetical protein
VFSIFSCVGSTCVASVFSSPMVMCEADWASRYRGPTISTLVVEVKFEMRQVSVADWCRERGL